MASSIVPPVVGSPGFARFIADHNPCYILSAICMILGIFALNDSFDWSPKPGSDVLWLLVTLSVYEWSLLGLAAFLWRRGIYRDGLFLLVIEAFFLVDVGFLNMEIFTIDPVLGLLVNVALLLLGLVKLAVVFRLVNLPIVSGLFAFVAVQLLALMAIPGLLADAATRNNGYLEPPAIYLAWWVAGVIPVLAIALARPVVRAAEFALLNRWSRMVAPVFVLLAARWDALVPERDRRRRVETMLPIVAIVLAALSPSGLLTFNAGFDVSPLRLTLLAAALVCVDGTVNFRHWNFAILGCGYLSAAGMGPTVPAMAQAGEARAVSSVNLLKMLIPHTSAHWGVLAVVSGFVLLAVGAALSVLRRPARVVIGSGGPLAVEAAAPVPYEPPHGTPFPLAPPPG